MFRWLRGTVLVARPGIAAIRVEGAAALAWRALDEPATAAEVEQRIAAIWTELEPAEPGLVSEALQVLVDGRLVTAEER